MALYKYRNVSERDMDLLFMEAIATDRGFLDLFISQTKNKDKQFQIVNIERSKIDSGLGETDITAIYEVEGEKYALLIENKIDAIAMPEQHERYIKRGLKGIESEEYNGFDIFIVCPEKYRQTNAEAIKYENYLSYEQCREYFSKRPDVLGSLWFQQITQAIETAKPEYRVDINEIAVDSFQKYAAYQKAYYPRLRLQNDVNSKKVNGWWPIYKVGIHGMYILHKTDRNCVDLTISGAADKLDELAIILKWLHENNHKELQIEKTGKSAAFRILTPDIKMYRPFETWKMSDLDICFEAIQELVDLAGMFAIIHNVIFNR